MQFVTNRCHMPSNRSGGRHTYRATAVRQLLPARSGTGVSHACFRRMVPDRARERTRESLRGLRFGSPVAIVLKYLGMPEPLVRQIGETENESRSKCHAWPWHLGATRRSGARSDDHGAGRADLRDDQLRFSRHRARGELVWPARIRQHLHASDEPDDRRAGKASRGARRRCGGTGVLQRPGGHHRLAPDDRPCRSELHFGQQPVRRDVDTVHADPRRNWASKCGSSIRASRKRFASLVDENTRAVYLETPGNPKNDVPDYRQITDIAHRTWVADDHRQHGADAGPVPTDRTRIRHRRVLDDEVHRWPRRPSRRCDCGQRQVPLGQGPGEVAGVHRTRPRLSRHDLRGSVAADRQHRLHPPHPHPLAARHGWLPEPLWRRS